MQVDVPLLIAIWPDISRDETQSLQASLSGQIKARFLQVLRSTMPMGTAKGAEMQLQVVVRRHGVGAMDFGCPEEVSVTTFIST